MPPPPALFPADARVLNFLFLGGSDPEALRSKIDDNVDGVQIVYSWKALEKQKDNYDFAQIERDLTFLTAKKKKLWIQIQDRFFEANDRLIPHYLQEEKIYDGGLAKQSDNPGEGLAAGHGWVTKHWNSNVRQRFQKLFKELAEKFDGRVYGINLPETSADIDMKREAKKGFSCDKYFAATLENINFARSVFAKTYVTQYVNFWPCEWENDHKYMSRFFQNAVKNKIGLGGPDILPYRKGQMKNAYPFFNQHKDELPIVAFAVQEPTRSYTNPNTKKKFTDEEFLDFGTNYLGAKVIFWSVLK